MILNDVKTTGNDHGLSLRSDKTTMYAPNFTFFAVPITYYQLIDGCSQTICLNSTSFRRRVSLYLAFFSIRHKNTILHGHPSKERGDDQTNCLTSTIN